jgi:hypothetical protein
MIAPGSRLHGASVRGASFRGLGGGTGQRGHRRGAHSAGKDDPAPEQRATIEQPVPGNGFSDRGLGSAATMIGTRHVFLPA